VESLGTFRPAYSAAWSAGMRRKLGLPVGLDPSVTRELVDELYALLQAGRVDFTSFFRLLSKAARGDREPARGLFLDLPAFDDWSSRWLALDPDPSVMDEVNPVYIPRNHRVEEALVAATEGDLELVARLLEAVSRPFDERPGLERYAEPAPVEFGDYQTFCGT
jgi:uncharacterized protein YdiU (UPF0061 family)